MTMKKLLLILLTTLLPMLASAYDIEVKNAAGVTIYYNYIYINNNTEVEVTYGDDYNGYTGNVAIPNSVTYEGVTLMVREIGGHAFSDCPELTSVNIPNSVTYIGDCAFKVCTSLISVYSLIENPNDIDSYAFDTAVYDNCTLYVPVGTTSKYEECKGWNDFAFIEEGAPASISTSKMVNKTKTKSYSIDGKMLNKPQKGLNIIQYSDGTTQKVVSK